MKIVLGVYDHKPHPMHYEWIDETWVLSDINPRHEKIIYADACNLSALKEPIEAIYASHVVEHIGPENIQGMFRDWYNVLPKGGYAIINVPNLVWTSYQLIRMENNQKSESDYFNTPKKIMEIIYGNVHDTDFDKHRWGYTKSLLRYYLEEAGFFVESIEERFDAHDMGVLIAKAVKKK